MVFKKHANFYRKLYPVINGQMQELSFNKQNIALQSNKLPVKALLTYKKHRIAKHQFAVFPKTTKQNIVS